MAGGGVRVNSQLMWSQLVSWGRFQELRTKLLFSAGELEARPSKDGFAIGSILLKNYSPAKYDLYFKNGSASQTEINRDDITARYAGPMYPTYANQPFEVFVGTNGDGSFTTPQIGNWKRWFSGTRTPSSNNTFGVYAPMPNGTCVRANYSNVIIPTGMITDQSGDDLEDVELAQQALKLKRAKYRSGRVPMGAGIVSVARNQRSFTYEISEIFDNDSGWIAMDYDNDVERISEQEFREGYPRNKDGKGGGGSISDMTDASIGAREEADSVLAIGETYILGQMLLTCTSAPDTIFYDGVNMNRKQYGMAALETGFNTGDGSLNTRWAMPVPGFPDNDDEHDVSR